MLKRTIAIAVVGAALAVMQVGETNAHGILVGSTWYYHSLGNDVTFKGVKQDGNTIWVAQILEWQFLCYNPAEKTASLQVMLREAILSGSQPFNQDPDWNKKQGRLQQSTELETESLVTPDSVTCETTPGGGHHNWLKQPETALVTKFHGVITTYDVDGNVISTTTQNNCTLPPGYDAAHLPTTNPRVFYQCDDPILVH